MLADMPGILLWVGIICMAAGLLRALPGKQ